MALLASSFGAVPASAAPTVPGAPSITSISSVVQGAKITFRKPANNGGASLIDYRVRCVSRDGGLKIRRSVARSPITVHGMSVGKTYTCTVVARNAFGHGPASAASDEVVPRPEPPRKVPGAARIGRIVEGVGTLLVGYSPPKVLPEWPINVYRARCSSSDGGVTQRGIKTHTHTLIPVTGLTPGKTYRCSIQARNVAGYGPPSELSQEAVPLFPPRVPGPPTITVAGSGTFRLVAISFRGPADEGGSRIIAFTVTCVSSKGGGTHQASARRSPIEVRGLRGGTAYTCTVRARNAVGLGPASAPTDPLVPQ